MISIIVAFDEDRAIAKDGTIPWHIPEDFKHFKQTTLNCSVIMGRVTWNTLPVKPLPNRTNIIISKFNTYTHQAFMVKSIDEAIKVAKRERPDKDIFIIGGLQVYKEALNLGIVEKIIASHIKGRFDGDLFFPEITWQSKLIKSYNEFDVYEYNK